MIAVIAGLLAVAYLFLAFMGLVPSPYSQPQNNVTGDLAQVLVPPSQLVPVVVKVLEENRRSGSLVYRGQCTVDGGMTDSFRVISPPRDHSPTEALRHAFVNDPMLRVKEVSPGMIRVVAGGVHPELLGVTIHDVKFQGENDPRQAANKLLASPEIKTYMQDHRTKFVTTWDGLIPPPSGRQMSGTPSDMTVSRALDRIAQTFPGVWIYDECVTGQGEKRVVIIFHEFSGPTSSH